MSLPPTPITSTTTVPLPPVQQVQQVQQVQPVPPTPSDESSAFNISIRAWLSIVIVFVALTLEVLGNESSEWLRTTASMVVATYFGQKRVSL